MALEVNSSTAVAEQPTNDGIDASRFHGSMAYPGEDPKPADSTPVPDAKVDETKTQPKTDDRARNEHGQFVKKEEKKDDKTEGKESKLPESLRPPKPKDPTDINARFHDLSRSHDELRRELQQARQELQALRTQPKVDPAKTEQPKSYSGKPKPRADDFESYEAYTEALTDWKIEEREAARQQQQSQTEAQRTYTEREQQFFQHAAPILAEVPNFEQIIRDPNLAMSDSMYHSIMHLGEIGPYTALYLAVHQDEARKLYHLSPQETFLAVGRLAQRLEGDLKQMAEQEQGSGSSQNGTPPAPAKTRTIPDLKGSTPATGDLDQEPQDTDDINTWRQKEYNRMSKKYPGQRFFR